MKVRVAVPRRPDGGRRDRLWAFCRDYWERTFAASVLDVEIREGLHEHGPFNRSAAVNAGAVGDWDVLVVLDGDVILDVGQVVAAIDRAAATGRAVLPYQRFCGLGEPMTERVLDGFSGSWESGVRDRYTGHVSSCVVVPRVLWDRVGGLDDRFEGWGHEDRAFHHACRVLGGGVDSLDGIVWHLWHPHSPERPRGRLRSPEYRAGAGLLARYYQALTPAALAELVAERRPVEDCVLVVVTDGRRECIAETIPAADKMLTGLPISRRVICDDSGDFDYQAWLRVEFPRFEVVGYHKRGGFAAAVRQAWNVALGSGQPWCFWLEDDFVIEREVDLRAMADVLAARPHLLQMALRRQAWFPAELEAGGVVERHPDAYEDRGDGEHAWLEHRLFWTTNPHLVSRRVLAAHTWPSGHHSEAAFAKQVLVGEARSGYWGSRDEEPWVAHVGAERVGKGY